MISKFQLGEEEPTVKNAQVDSKKQNTSNLQVK